MKKSLVSKFYDILDDIKSVKIQGAENVAKAGIKAFLFNPSKRAAKQILKVRETEPLLQNAIKFLLKSKDIEKDAERFLKDLEKSHEATVKKGSVLIKNGMNVYTHCHSSTVIDILKYAKKKGKKFVVYTSEVEPLLQGRMTAKDLAKSKINVVVTSDLAAENSIAKCDLFLFGADAFSKKEVANKIGTSTLVKLARIHNVPRYSCGIALKFTKRIKIEKRSGREVWDEREKNIEVVNLPFDKTKLDDLNGVVCEFGILKKREFVKRAREKIKCFALGRTR